MNERTRAAAFGAAVAAGLGWNCSPTPATPISASMARASTGNFPLEDSRTPCGLRSGPSLGQCAG